MKTSKFLAVVCCLSLCISFSVAAATTDELIERININQARNIAYILTPEEVAQLENSDDPVAHYFLGLVYAEGDTPDTPRDQCKAAEHMQISARGGYPYAQLYLGYAVLWNIGVTTGSSIAFAQIEDAQRSLIAAKQSDPSALTPYNYAEEKNIDHRVALCLDHLRTEHGVRAAPLGAMEQLIASKPCIRSNVLAPLTTQALRQATREEISERALESFGSAWCVPPSISPVVSIE